MLQFPYLLSFLICIELSFCYNYIDKGTEHNKENFRRNLRRDNVRRVNRPIIQRNSVRQEEDYDKNPVEFDVASFIKPETENSEADESFTSHKNKGRRWNEKHFGIGSMMKSDNTYSKLKKGSDYMSMGDPELNMYQPLSKDLLKAKYVGYNPLEDQNAGKYGHEKLKNINKHDLLMNPNVVHNQEKKCSLKAIKFPFFSHNKSETLKPKKNRKRKLFFFNDSKKDIAPNPGFNEMSDDTMIFYKMKRSYEQRLCPACKKLFVASMEHYRPRKNPKKIIHNSRQFYQNTLPDAKLKEDIRDFKTNKIPNTVGKFRMKRHDSDRQLQELEEVQKKIDAVEINVPHLNIPTEKDVEHN